MSLPTQNSEYGTKEYWDSRYSEADDSETFDWFKDYQAIKGEIEHLLPSKTSLIINLGCGNSLFAPQLQKEGWTNISNVDYSDACISKMKKIYPDMQWIVCDVFTMDKLFIEGTFDSAIDKGTLDAFLTKKHDPWDPEQEILEEIRSYIMQVAKVLKSGGKFIHITFAQPHFRKRFLEYEGFSPVKVHKLQSDKDTFEYFCYEVVKI